MFRSPPQLRSGSKSQPIPLTSSDKKLVRSLSSSSTSSCPELRTMAPTDKPGKVDPVVVADCVNKYLAGNDVVTQLVARLTEELKSVVEAAVRTALTSVNLEVEKLRGEVANLSEKVRQLDDKLTGRADELEQYQRRNNIRVFGIEETAGENTDAIVVGLCRDKLGVDLPVSAICRSHRVGGHPRPGPDGSKRHRPIIVRFVSYRDRRAVYGHKKNLKGTGVTIREDLTTQRVEVLRRATAQYGPRSTWTQDGRVLWINGDGVKGVATRLSDLTSRPAAIQ
uniref:Uncharacterized protein n=1 Tax=Graphocephala atropunctata TaxID=36148 RepID=A0A1B6MF41_9HEMI